MFTRILDIISGRIPGMTISSALEMAREIEKLVTPTRAISSPVVPDSVPLSLEMIRATAWAERVFSRDDLNRKIAVIKVLRNEWSLSLKNAKDIADNLMGCASVSYWD